MAPEHRIEKIEIFFWISPSHLPRIESQILDFYETFHKIITPTKFETFSCFLFDKSRVWDKAWADMFYKLVVWKRKTIKSETSGGKLMTNQEDPKYFFFLIRNTDTRSPKKF